MLILVFLLVIGAGALAIGLGGFGFGGGNDETPTASEETSSAAFVPTPTSIPATPTPFAPPATVAPPTATPVPPTPVPATPIPAATPTPLSPPAWEPTDGGPTSSPFTYIVTASTSEIESFDAPDGADLGALTSYAADAPLVLRVLEGAPGDEWIEVDAPNEDDSRRWVRGESMVWGWSNRLLRVVVDTNQLQLFEGNEVLFEASVVRAFRPAPRRCSIRSSPLCPRTAMRY